jgi:hypothetical protein
MWRLKSTAVRAFEPVKESTKLSREIEEVNLLTRHVLGIRGFRPSESMKS